MTDLKTDHIAPVIKTLVDQWTSRVKQLLIYTCMANWFLTMMERLWRKDKSFTNDGMEQLDNHVLSKGLP